LITLRPKFGMRMQIESRDEVSQPAVATTCLPSTSPQRAE
jgi:hypothetical protein